jgi:hypothetical protein
MSIQHINATAQSDLLVILKTRFEKNIHRHKKADWNDVLKKLENQTEKLWNINEMEQTGGEPDVVDFNDNEIYFVDCAEESPKGRRSFCYDKEALDARKENKPENNAIGFANEMGVEILSEEQYRHLQTLGKFDLKTSSWLKTPPEIRKLGGAIFGDFRYNQVFIYHNGVQSYYASRGFRGRLKI